MCTPCCNWCLIAIGPFMIIVNPLGWVIIWPNLYHPEWEVDQEPPSSRVVSSRLWCLWEYPFWCAAHVASWVKLWYGVEITTYFVVFGPLGWVAGSGHCQTLYVTIFQLPICSHHIVPYLCLKLLNLCVQRKVNLCKRVNFFQHKAGGNSVEVWGSTSTFNLLHPPQIFRSYSSLLKRDYRMKPGLLFQVFVLFQILLIILFFSFTIA